MKKITTILAVALFSVALISSCEKNSDQALYDAEAANTNQVIEDREEGEEAYTNQVIEEREAANTNQVIEDREEGEEAYTNQVIEEREE